MRHGDVGRGDSKTGLPTAPWPYDICRRVEPRRLDVDGHQVWCHVVEQELGGKESPEPDAS